MITYSKQGIIRFALVLALLPLMGVALYERDAIDGILAIAHEKLKEYDRLLPEDKTYIHVDKPLYKPGETIWFAAYARNGNDMQRSRKSDIVYVELIDPKGNTMKKLTLIADEGVARGDFTLSQHAAGGLYKLKAYTQWQQNDTASMFERELQVQAVVLPRLKMTLDFTRKAYGPGQDVRAELVLQTLANEPLKDYEFSYVLAVEGQETERRQGRTGEDGSAFITCSLPATLSRPDAFLNVIIAYQGRSESIGRSIPISLNNIDLAFFPEGGEMLAGYPSRVAFKALNEHGLPADVEGEIVDAEGRSVATFASFHDGMGAFSFTPIAGRDYSARISRPAALNTLYPLPRAVSDAVGLALTHKSEHWLQLQVYSPRERKLALVGQTRGREYYSNAFVARRGSNRIDIPLETFPAGVAQFTLFDSQGVAYAERLAFVNKSRQLDVQISSDRERYEPRQKTRLTITTRDPQGSPVAARLSLAVSDDKLLSFADDKSSTILSALLLESDLKQTVREPRFYFDRDEPKADSALDYLLMTAGWRRFVWKELLSDSIPAARFSGERALIAGKVTDEKGHALEGVQVSLSYHVSFSEPEMSVFRTGDDGSFELRDIDLDRRPFLEVELKDTVLGRYQISRYDSQLSIRIARGSSQIFSVYHQDHARPVSGGLGMAYGDALGGFAIRGQRLQNTQFRVEGLDINDQFGGALAEAPAEVVEVVAERIVVPLPDQAQRVPRESVKAAVALQAGVQLRRNAGLKLINPAGVGRVAPDGKRAFFQGTAVAGFHQPAYYRAREFPAPDYAGQPTPETRSDFRSTIYWNAAVETDSNGLATLEFYNSDEVTAFRVVAEGIGAEGHVGRAEYLYHTQLPFSIAAKAPRQVVSDDIIELPVTLTNTTDEALQGSLQIHEPHNFELLESIERDQRLDARSSKTLYLRYKATTVGQDHFDIAFTADGLRDAFRQEIAVAPRGFPASIALSGADMDKSYSIDLAKAVPGSLRASLTAFPSIGSTLLAGVDALLREPTGCFEQTSSSNYPNLLALRYLREAGEDDPALEARATAMLDRGYARLVSFETSSKGYEWFGKAPGHEALSAYGLMQFVDMQSVYPDVDGEMIDRTTRWLLERRDGKGGFTRNPKALDSYGRAESSITNAYIVYALSEAGVAGIDAELEAVYRKAEASEDAYLIALVANALLNLRDVRAADLLTRLVQLQEHDGHWRGRTHSITRSGGQALTIETTSLAMMAILKSPSQHRLALERAARFLMEQRSARGGFASTQSTIMALKALTAYTVASRKTEEAGAITLAVNDELAASRDYAAGAREAIVLDKVERYFRRGVNALRVRYEDTHSPLPYTLALEYSTDLPQSSDECVVELDTRLGSTSTREGETVRFTAVLSNTSSEGQPMTIAVLGIPAGLSPQPRQLKELQEQGAFDFYEIHGGYVVCYYRDMAPQEKHEIMLDLKAEIPGEFLAPASSAYLYYTDEHKVWSSAGTLTISR